MAAKAKKHPSAVRITVPDSGCGVVTTSMQTIAWFQRDLQRNCGCFVSRSPAKNRGVAPVGSVSITDSSRPHTCLALAVASATRNSPQLSSSMAARATPSVMFRSTERGSSDKTDIENRCCLSRSRGAGRSDARLSAGALSTRSATTWFRVAASSFHAFSRKQHVPVEVCPRRSAAAPNCSDHRHRALQMRAQNRYSRQRGSSW